MDRAPLPFHCPLIAILRGIRPNEVEAHAEALIEVGFDAIEVPTNSPDWARSVALLNRRWRAQACVGAGTVLTVAHLDALQAAGGQLMVTPNTQPELIRLAVERGLFVIAGVATPSEAFAALQMGAQALKLFPASVFGVPMVHALRAVLPEVPLFAVGGVTPESLRDYLSAGCAGFGIGGELYRPGQTVAQTRDAARRFLQSFLEASA